MNKKVLADTNDDGNVKKKLLGYVIVKKVLKGIELKWKRWHKGIDIGARYEPVYVSASGYAYTLKEHGGYGNFIIIVHGDGWCTLYGILKSYNVSYGQYVIKGQIIGQSGIGEGGQNFHFETRKEESLSGYFNSNFLNPLDFSQMNMNY